MTNHKPTHEYCYLDFEFNHSHHKDMNVVCCSSLYNDTVSEFWTYNNPEGVSSLVEYFKTLEQKGVILVAYLASAESRSLESLGIDAMKFQWVDLYAEFRQLKMNSDRYSYGRYLRKHAVGAGPDGISYKRTGYSTPPSMIKEENEGKDCTEVGWGLADAVYRLLNVDLNTAHKNKMRDIIIADKEVEENKEAIQEYCTSDITYLPALQDRMQRGICESFNLTKESYEEIAISRGRYAGPVIARVEREGLPFDVESATHLSENMAEAKDRLIDSYRETVEYPFYLRQKRTLKDFKGIYVNKYSLFENYVSVQLNVSDSWPKTKAGKLSQDNDDLKEFDGDKNIAPYRQVKKALQGLQMFDPTSKSAKDSGMIMDKVGPDGRLRSLMGVFGSQTGRNQPRARNTPFLMGRWARSLIKPPKDHVVGSIDWVSEEWIVGALQSGDANMIEAYMSGDPYMWFAIAAGAAPSDATKKTHPTVRGRFKSTSLGVGYGMACKRLARKLTVDTGILHTEKDAQKLINLHKKTFRDYWRFRKHTVRTYKRDGFLMQADGWSLNSNCDRELSVCNFPGQGCGGVLLRRAMVKGVEQDIPIVAPLHDAIYICSHKDSIDADMDRLSKVMDETVAEVLGPDAYIGQDKETHPWNETWIEEGAEPVYNALAPFMQPFESPTKKRTNRVKELLS